MNEIKFAEFEKGHVYALPIEQVRFESAQDIQRIAECRIILLPDSCFDRVLTSKIEIQHDLTT